MVHHLPSNLLCLNLLGLDLLSLSGAADERGFTAIGRVADGCLRLIGRRRHDHGPRVLIAPSERGGSSDGRSVSPRASRRASSQTSVGIAGGTLRKADPRSVSHCVSA